MAIAADDQRRANERDEDSASRRRNVRCEIGRAKMEEGQTENKSVWPQRSRAKQADRQTDRQTDIKAYRDKHTETNTNRKSANNTNSTCKSTLHIHFMFPVQQGNQHAFVLCLVCVRVCV